MREQKRSAQSIGAERRSCDAKPRIQSTHRTGGRREYRLCRFVGDGTECLPLPQYPTATQTGSQYSANGRHGFKQDTSKPPSVVIEKLEKHAITCNELSLP